MAPVAIVGSLAMIEINEPVARDAGAERVVARQRWLLRWSGVALVSVGLSMKLPWAADNDIYRDPVQIMFQVWQLDHSVADSRTVAAADATMIALGIMATLAVIAIWKASPSWCFAAGLGSVLAFAAEAALASCLWETISPDGDFGLGPESGIFVALLVTGVLASLQLAAGVAGMNAAAPDG